MTVHDRRGDRPDPQGGEGRASSKTQSRNGGESEKLGKVEGRPKVLARLPDLDITELDRIIDADPPAEGKRPLAQRISTVALIGVGALFVVVALQPYMGRRGGGMQPPAPSAPVAPAWDATAKNTPATPAVQQVQAAPPVPVSIPALPTSIPAVPDSIQGPATPSSNSSGMPVPSFNKQSQVMPSDAAAPGVAEASSDSSAAKTAAADVHNAQLASPPAVTPSAPYGAPVAASYQTVATQPGYYATTNQAVPNQAMAIQPGVTPAYPNYPQTADASANPAAAFAGAANTAASLNAYGPSAEPGVARLQGVIEKSTQRPSYDSARSSLR